MFSKEYLNKVFTYKDGKLFWKKNISNIKAGSEAGCLNNYGYRVVRLDKQLTLTHRLIWIMHFGSIPKNKQIDHINQIRCDNRVKNLRLVSHQENGKNQKLRSTNKSGCVGVTWWPSRKTWVARITIDGRTKTLGYFYNKEDAIKCRMKASAANGFHQNHGT